MVQVKALVGIASRLSLEEFVTRCGPIALLQNPPDLVLQEVAQTLALDRTVAMAHGSRLVERIVGMLRRFEQLEVLFLEARAGTQLAVGRGSGCALWVQDPSVSKHHATFRWDDGHQCFTVQDELSDNRTFVNAIPLGPDEQAPLMDGDCICFGDAQFLYLHTQSLHAHLISAGQLTRTPPAAGR